MEKSNSFETTCHHVQFAVIGGGLAGMFCAISAARHGVKVALMQDRPMFGGNASSEIRMWIRGARGRDKQETGLVEELALENIYRNPTLNFHVWDSVLYGMVRDEENIEMILNCSCLDADMNADKSIKSVTGWQTTTQKYHKIHADIFADCSGDSILAPLTGASYRVGREGTDEFSETIAPAVSDKLTMGMSCLIQARNTGHTVKYTAPEWAKKYSPNDFPHRLGNSGSGWKNDNFWWMELGGMVDSIADAETVRDELLSVATGVWDCIKNSGAYEGADTWELDFLGFLPGKRESRRYAGQHILCQKEVESGGKFPDTVAYGGWSMDDHDPMGMNTAERPTTFHPAPSPYGIPLRSMISADIANLVFAGRNISATHAALSSTRVMATCAVIGQAVGCASAVAIDSGISPQKLYPNYVEAVQRMLQLEDCYLPGIKYRQGELMKKAEVNATSGDASMLTNGINRTIDNAENVWQGVAGVDEITLDFTEEKDVSRLTIVFDSDINRDSWKDTQPDFLRDYPMYCAVPESGYNVVMPATLAKSAEITYLTADGAICGKVMLDNNRRRLVRIDNQVKCAKIKIKINETWLPFAATNDALAAEARIYFIEAE